MKNVTFLQLNHGWNAEPNAPFPTASIEGNDVLLKFYVNAFQFSEFNEDEKGILRFVDCQRYRLGLTNDEGWWRGQCRFSKLAPSWGEFYLIHGDAELLTAPNDWIIVNNNKPAGSHFLFYFRDDTFECVAENCIVEPSEINALYRREKFIAPR